MRILYIFDKHCNFESPIPSSCCGSASEIDLFPLTGISSIIQQVRDMLARFTDNSIIIINSANAVDDQTASLRRSLYLWTSKIGSFTIKEKAIKEWFLLLETQISSWWLSLLSEKNPWKTGAFLETAQIRAVKKHIDTSSYDVMILSLGSSTLQSSLIRLAKNRKIRVFSTRVKTALNNRVKALLNKSGLYVIIGALAFLIQTVSRCLAARHHLGRLNHRMPDSNSLLFVSHFPAYDNEAYKKGVFINKYASELQSLLQKKQIPIVWIFMYVCLYGSTFNNALTAARIFSRNGEKLFFIEEFANSGICLRALVLWIRQFFISKILYKKTKGVLLTEPFLPECEPLIKSLWDISFCGYVGMEGILYYLLYEEAFKRIKNVGGCLYYFEMVAWEKAINAAKKRFNPDTKTIAFQHTTISKNYFSYFYDKNETAVTGEATDMPLPDILAANGELMYELLSTSGFQCLTQLEAIRQLYLNNILNKAPESANRLNVLLVAGSGSSNMTESLALASQVIEAFPISDNPEIWFKGHPSMPFERVLKVLGIELEKTGYMIKSGDIADFLREVAIVIVSSSTVALEALACGCEVIIPFFPDAIQMNPLADFERFYHRVTSAVELKETVISIQNGNRRNNIQESRSLLNRYWNLDPELPRWSELLSAIFDPQE